MKNRLKRTQPQQEGGEGGEGEGQVELDPYAGTDVDASQLGQMQEEAMTRNKPSMSVGPPNRNTGLPAAAANNNVDRRTE